MKTVSELVLDPKWETGDILLDGNQVSYMSFIHPRHGELFFHMTPESIKILKKYLNGDIPN